jgi:hypothetical protein
MSEYPDLMTRLDAVERALIDTADDDFAARHRLHTERDALRRLIHDLQGDLALADERPTPEIEREIEALVASAEAIRDRRINVATQAGSANSLGNVPGEVGLNERIGAASGYAAIQQRIGQLETILEQRSD